MSSLSRALIFLLLCLTTASWAKPKGDSPQDRFENLTALTFRGQHQEALVLLSGFQEKKSKGAWKARLQFLRGYLQLQAGQYAAAAESFEKIDPTQFPLPDYAAFYRAVALREAGSAAEAVSALQKLQRAPLSPHLRRKAGRELALAYCKAGERGPAIDGFNALIQNETDEVKTYRLRFDRAQCLIQLGNTEEAWASLRQLYLSYPEGDLSASLLESMKRIRPDAALTLEDHRERAARLLARGRPDLAASDLEAAARLDPSPSLESRLKLAETYFQARRYVQAAQAWEEIRASAPDLLTTENLENLAKAYSRSDQFDRAMGLYQELLDQDPEGAQAASYLFKIAFLTFDKGDYAGAVLKFQKLLERFPRHPQRESALWYVAWSHYLLKNWDESLRFLGQLEGAGSLSSEGLHYWRARIYEKQGKTGEAQAAYRAIREEDPLSYYGLLSAKRLENHFAAADPPKRNGLPLSREKIPPPFRFEPSDSAAASATNRLKDLLLAGLWEDFLGELAFVAQNEGVPAELNELNASLSHPSGRVAEEEGNWSARFPPAYSTLVLLFSDSRGIPPALTWAVMREESRFRSEALSSAGAIGLMQIIPPTGFEIARDLGRTDFTPDELNNPVVNIEYGAHYLAKNLDRFQNGLTSAIAAYNAGPEAVERWTRARPGREWDEFVEEIPYKETNHYVKKVLRSYYVYRLMYAD
jgi:soluble lytic murein transglycosylase